MDIPKFKIQKRKPTVVSEDDCTRLLRAAGRHRLMVWTLLCSGLRISELIALRKTDIQGNHIVVRAETTKTSQERHVLVPHGLVLELAALTTDPLFPMSRHAAYQRLVRIARRVRVANVWTHKLRATYATKLLQSGVDVGTVAHQFGHQSLQPTIRYLAGLEDGKLLDKIESVLGRNP